MVVQIFPRVRGMARTENYLPQTPQPPTYVLCMPLQDPPPSPPPLLLPPTCGAKAVNQKIRPRKLKVKLPNHGAQSLSSLTRGPHHGSSSLSVLDHATISYCRMQISQFKICALKGMSKTKFCSVGRATNPQAIMHPPKSLSNKAAFNPCSLLSY